MFIVHSYAYWFSPQLLSVAFRFALLRLFLLFPSVSDRKMILHSMSLKVDCTMMKNTFLSYHLLSENPMDLDDMSSVGLLTDKKSLIMDFLHSQTLNLRPCSREEVLNLIYQSTLL